jgi:hypothetical protein
MNTVEPHTKDIDEARAKRIRFEGDTLHVDLTDGRTISTPINWYPRLLHATPEQRERWELLGGGYGIHWEEIDEDLSVPAMLSGRKGVEEQPPFRSFEIQPRQPSSSPAQARSTGAGVSSQRSPAPERSERQTPIKPALNTTVRRQGGYRSATTGRFVSSHSVKHSPATTYTERGEKPGKSDSDKDTKAGG